MLSVDRMRKHSARASQRACADAVVGEGGSEHFLDLEPAISLLVGTLDRFG